MNNEKPTQTESGKVRSVLGSPATAAAVGNASDAATPTNDRPPSKATVARLLGRRALLSGADYDRLSTMNRKQRRKWAAEHAKEIRWLPTQAVAPSQ